MKISNKEIVKWGDNILYFLENSSTKDKYIPILINFYMQKNFKQILKFYYEIIENKDNIIKHYGVPEEDNNYFIPSEHIDEAMKEIDTLMSIEQEIDIKKIPISIFCQEKLNLSIQEMECILPMIEDDIKDMDVFSFLSSQKGEKQHFKITLDNVDK